MFMLDGGITRSRSLLFVLLLTVACSMAVPASAKGRGDKELGRQTATLAAALAVAPAVGPAAAVAIAPDVAPTLAPVQEPLSLAPGPSVPPQDTTPASLAKQAEASEAALSFLNRDHFRSLEVTATGYYAGPESTGKSPGHPEYGITYSGVKVRKGLFSTIAADTRVFPLGTILYIPGYGFGVVSDTGNAIKGNKIDLYFETKQQVYDLWGKKKVKVSVLRRGDGKVTEDMLDELNAIADTGATRADATVD